MSEIERYTPRTEITVPAVDSWKDVFQPIVALAEHVANTDFVPRGVRGNPAATAAAMLYGRELGMGPMKSLQNVYVIDGTPTLKPQEMRAMVLAAGHSLRWGERTKARCLLAGRRRDETEWTTVEWSMQDARDLNLAHKPNWKRMPRQMLVARATGELCRLIFPDVIGGAYTPEEIADGAGEMEPAAMTAPEPAKPPARAKRRTPVQPSTQPQPETAEPSSAQPHDHVHEHAHERTDEPPLPDEITDAEVVEDQPAPTAAGASSADERKATPDQLRKLHAFFTTHQITDRDHKLRIARVLTGRADLNSSTELTVAEASTLIDALTQLSDQAADGDFVATLELLMTELGARMVTDTPEEDTP